MNKEETPDEIHPDLYLAATDAGSRAHPLPGDRRAPPPTVKLLGRWTQVDLCGGVVLLESDDPQALAEFARGWSDLLELTIEKSNELLS